MLNLQGDKCAAGLSVVLLAAGRASRMGNEKVLLDLGGRPVIRWVADTIAGLGFAEVLVVANPRNHEQIEAALSGLEVRVLINHDFERGLSSSLRVGLAAVGRECAGLMLMQGDQPLVSREMLIQLMEAWERGGRIYAASSYDGQVTTPVLFGRTLFAELAGLQGDVGARAVLRRHRGEVVAFPAWRGSDIDTPSDFEKVKALWTELRATASQGGSQ